MQRLGLAAVLLAAAAVLTHSSGAGESVDAERFRVYGSQRSSALREDPPDAGGAGAPAAGAGAPAAGAANGAPAAAAGADGGGSDECDVCTYVLENKELLQPYLCRGLNDPSQQMTVRTRLLSASFCAAYDAMRALCPLLLARSTSPYPYLEPFHPLHDRQKTECNERAAVC